MNTLTIISTLGLMFLISCSSSNETTNTRTETTTRESAPDPITETFPAEEQPAPSEEQPTDWTETVVIDDQPASIPLAGNPSETPASKRYFHGKKITDRGDTVKVSFTLDDQNKMHSFSIDVRYAPVKTTETRIVEEKKREETTKPWYQFIIELNWTILALIGLVVVGGLVYLRVTRR